VGHQQRGSTNRNIGGGAVKGSIPFPRSKLQTSNIMKLVLNIGRGIEISGTRVDLLSVGNIVAAVDKLLGNISSIHCHESDSEPTVVAVIDGPDMDIAKAVNQLCLTLSQDAIAYTVDGEGHMEGPKAAEWGPFNPTYFVQPNGQRLA
jgi:hypothetical protein